MYSKFLFNTLIVTIILLMQTQSIYGEKALPKSKDLLVKQKVSQILENLEKNLKKTKMEKEKFNFIKKAETEIKDFRKKNPRQSESDEIYFDSLEHALGYIPRDSAFKKAECGKIQNQIYYQLEPSASETNAPATPAVINAVSVLKELCK